MDAIGSRGARPIEGSEGCWGKFPDVCDPGFKEGLRRGAAAYQEYMEGALRHPAFVGCHWFQYQDEPTTGRVYDEENYQIGFIDIADTPYRETIAASRAVAAKLYSTRLGK